MTGYNKINGEYAGGNSVLIQGVLKGAWGYPGWVMSDWGGTPGWEAALTGLDQEGGRPGHRRDPDGRGEPVGTAAGHLPG
jgi:beta-glucosidase-like glycosyl hydrolase